ncbi:hypothetical protein Q1695_014396 [Nippostrongylus brasiliensis]|nr:hypothetical protein Q1695_014396 [Nippostrongylus brasiliensis]
MYTTVKVKDDEFLTDPCAGHHCAPRPYAEEVAKRMLYQKMTDVRSDGRFITKSSKLFWLNGVVEICEDASNDGSVKEQLLAEFFAHGFDDRERQFSRYIKCGEASFPNAKMKGCAFHLAQACNRKKDALGLRQHIEGATSDGIFLKPHETNRLRRRDVERKNIINRELARFAGRYHAGALKPDHDVNDRIVQWLRNSTEQLCHSRAPLLFIAAGYCLRSREVSPVKGMEGNAKEVEQRRSLGKFGGPHWSLIEDVQTACETYQRSRLARMRDRTRSISRGSSSHG